MNALQRAEYRITYGLDGINHTVSLNAIDIEAAIAMFRSNPVEDMSDAEILNVEKIHHGEIIHALR
jgi:hypothetical protein